MPITERDPRAPTCTLPEIWVDGQPIDWPSWVLIQRANGWPQRSRETLRLADVPADQLNLHYILDAAARGELYG